MIIIREFFVRRPRQAGKLAAMLKDVATTVAPGKSPVMTGLTGRFNRVIMETEVGSLAELEERMKDYMSNPAWKAKMKGYTDLWTTGGRETLRVV
jgi:hypothetical protein